MPYVAADSRTVYFCGCKATKAPPLCDGSHARI
jgi:CDGSH-type Zn-finger protein